MNIMRNATVIACGTAARGVARLVLPRHGSSERRAVFDVGCEAMGELAGWNSGRENIGPCRNHDPNLSVGMFGPASGVGLDLGLDLGLGRRFEGREGAGWQSGVSVMAGQLCFELGLAKSVEAAA